MLGLRRRERLRAALRAEDVRALLRCPAGRLVQLAQGPSANRAALTDWVVRPMKKSRRDHIVLVSGVGCFCIM